MPDTSTTALASYDASAGPQLQGIDLINLTLAAASSAREKISMRIGDTDNEIQRLQIKASEVDDANQGKIKKLQSKSKFAIDKLKELQVLRNNMDVATSRMKRRQLDHKIVLEIRNRTMVIDGKTYLETDEHAMILRVIGQRRSSEAHEIREAQALVQALPKEFRD